MGSRLDYKREYISKYIEKRTYIDKGNVLYKLVIKRNRKLYKESKPTLEEIQLACDMILIRLGENPIYKLKKKL